MSAQTIEQLAAALAQGVITLEEFTASAVARSTQPKAATAVAQPEAAAPVRRARRAPRQATKLTFGEARSLDSKELRAAWNADRISVRDMERLVALRKSRTGTPFRKAHVRALQELEQEVFGG